MPKKQPVIDTEVNPLFGEETDFVAVPATEMFSEEEPEVPEVQPEPEKKPEDKPKEYSQEEKDNMLAIVDAIMFEGEYSEVFSFGRKYKVTFRSRTAGEDNAISQKLDGRVFNTLISYQNQSSLLTMAYSLKDLNGVDYSEMSIKDRYDKITELPSPLVIILSELMSKFDKKVLEAMEYGKANF
jgi:hypothetical protein